MRILEALYGQDAEFARRIIVGTRAEADAELEQLAFRWRSGRLADLGYADYYEALAVYEELDPTTVRPGTGPADRVRPLIDASEADGGALRLPTALVERLASGGPFARAVGRVPSGPELAEIHFALVALSNRVLAADRVRPGDDDAVRATLERMAAALDLAVEFVARGRDEEAVAAVRTIPLVKLFRVATSLVGKVRRLALALLRQSPFAAVPELDLFEAEDADVLEAVTRPRPLFPRRLDAPPATGARPFSSMADVARATAAVERAGATLALLMGLGVRPEHLGAGAWERLGVRDPKALDAGLLARTALALAWLDKPHAPPRPLETDERRALATWLARAAEDAGFAEAARQRLEGVLVDPRAGTGGAPEAVRGVARRWVEGLLGREPVLGR
jgi:hypothetical protein